MHIKKEDGKKEAQGRRYFTTS